MTKQERQQLNSAQALKALYFWWAELNDSNFQGALKKCPDFIISDKVKYLAAYSFKLTGKKVHGGKIIISTKLFYHAPKSIFKDALLHEMAHQFCIEELHLPFEEHGSIWKFICKACGANPIPQSLWKEKIK